MLIGHHHHVGGAQPLALQLVQGDLDGHQADHLAPLVVDGLRQEVAGLAGGGADAVEAPAARGQGLLHVGAEVVVLAHVVARRAPVAGGHGNAMAVDQGQGRGLAGAVGPLQLAVQVVHIARRQRVLQRGAQLVVQGQHLGQGAVAVHPLGQRLGTHGQLALEDFALADQGLAPSQPAHQQHAQQHAQGESGGGPEGAAAGNWHARECAPYRVFLPVPGLSLHPVMFVFIRTKARFYPRKRSI